MLAPAVTRSWAARHDPTIRFLLVWLLAPVLALEIFSNKPPLYTVHAVFPAGALLVALAVGRIEPFARELKAWPGMFVATTVLLVAIAPVLFGGILWVTGTPVTPLLLAGFISLAGLFIYAAWVSAHGYGMAWFSSAVLGTFILGLWFNGLLMPGLNNFWTAPQIEKATARLKKCSAGPVHISGFREPSLALAVAGRARIGSPDQAAATVAGPENGAAIIESRQIDRFQKAVANAPGAPSLRRLGCIRAFNLARGCSLLFDVFVRADPGSRSRCDLALPIDCTAGHRFLRTRLKIKHCG